MEIKKSIIGNIGIGLVIGVILVGGLFFFNKSDSTEQTNIDAVSMSGDTQIIDLTAKGGYSPSVIDAKAGKETILRVSTNNTFDCSSSFRIPELDINKMLPANGKTEFTIAAQESGAEIEGTCSMGMYSFKIKFS